jgi:hypothetical protein
LYKSTLESLNYICLDCGLNEMNPNQLVKINVGDRQACFLLDPGLHAIVLNNLIKINTGEPQQCFPGPWTSCDSCD